MFSLGNFFLEYMLLSMIRSKEIDKKIADKACNLAFMDELNGIMYVLESGWFKNLIMNGLFLWLIWVSIFVCVCL